MHVSIIDSYYKIFSEGANDSKFRQMAMDTYRKALDSLSRISSADLMFPKAGKPIVSVNIGELLDDNALEDLDLWFIARDSSEEKNDAGRFVVPTAKGKRRIELYVDVPEDAFKRASEPNVWRGIVVKNAAKVLKRAKEVFWHEFIHYMDFSRMGKDSQGKAFSGKTRKDPKKYYNDPVETNAFIQQGLMRIEDHLTGMTDRSAVENLIGKSPNDFYNLVLKVISRSAIKNMNDNNKNKLKKRVARMWNDTMGRLGGNNK